MTAMKHAPLTESDVTGLLGIPANNFDALDDQTRANLARYVEKAERAANTHEEARDAIAGLLKETPFPKGNVRKNFSQLLARVTAEKVLARMTGEAGSGRDALVNALQGIKDRVADAMQSPAPSLMDEVRDAIEALQRSGGSLHSYAAGAAIKELANSWRDGVADGTPLAAMALSDIDATIALLTEARALLAKLGG